MVRPIPAERFRQLVDVATRTFVVRGYRLTQMSDIAEALGVAKGTLYGYVESKEALFDAAVRYSDGHSVEPPGDSLPLPTPEKGSTAGYVRERLSQEVGDLELVRVLSRPRDCAPQEGEFELIMRDLFRRMSRNRRALKLIDRCAIDHPELARVWFEQGRYGQVALLASYLETMGSAGHVRVLSNVQLAARMVLETIALWAIHMPWDPAPQTLIDDEVESAVVDMLVHAYLKEKTS